MSSHRGERIPAKRVLIVHPDRLLMDSLVDNLEHSGLSVLGITSVELGEHHLPGFQPDAVIVDAHMAGTRKFLDHLWSRCQVLKVIVLSRHPHKLGNGNLVVVDTNHGLQYLTTVIKSVLGGAVTSSESPILVANPRQEAREALLNVIQELGHATYAVESSEDVLGFLAKLPETRVAFLDIHLSGRGGLDTLRKIVSDGVHPEIIITSEYSDLEIARHALKLGAFDYIYEPIERSVVEGSIAAAFAHADYRREQSLWGRIMPRFMQAANGSEKA